MGCIWACIAVIMVIVIVAFVGVDSIRSGCEGCGSVIIVVVGCGGIVVIIGALVSHTFGGVVTKTETIELSEQIFRIHMALFITNICIFEEVDKTICTWW